MTLRLWPLLLPLLLPGWTHASEPAEPASQPASVAVAAEPPAAAVAVPATDTAGNSETAADTDLAAGSAAASSEASVTDSEDAEHLLVRVADPFIDLHTGPGRGYPKFQVVERGGLITLLERRTEWFLVRGPRGHEGWVHREQLQRTLTVDGELVDVSEASQADFAKREWETGVMAGLFENADVISIYGAWGFTENLSLELTLGHVMGDFSNAKYGTLHLTHQPFPEWWISPYFQLGTGYIRTDPAATIIQTEDRGEQLTHVGVGARTYLTRRFVLRVEYNNYVVLTDRNDNEKVEEWKAGFSLFF
ncbi:MAG: SH3 domain-containing protein [Permianibacter sp.]